MTVNKSLPPRFLKWRSSTNFIIFVVTMAVFTDILFYALIIPFIPVILNERIGVPEDDLQLWSSVFLGVYGGAVFVASPVCGSLADSSKSRQLPLLLGLVAMACATAMLHFGMTIWILTLARVFQGISAAILYSAGLALLYDSVGNDKIGYAMGYVTMAFTAGTVIGPSLGGILYQYGREPAVFGLAYAVIAIDIVLRSLVIEKDTAKKYGLEAAGPGYGTIDANPPEPTPAPDPHMLKSEVRFPSLLLLKTPRLLTALFGWLVVGILLTAFDAVLPLFVGSTFSWSTAGAGVIFLPVFLPNIASPLYGRLVDSSKHAVRLVAAFGFTFNLPFFVLLRLAAAHKSLATQVLFCVLLFLIGLGLALCGPPLFVEVARVVAMFEEERGPGAFGGKGVAARAYGLFNCAFAAGQVLGPLWAGAVKEAYGWATMAWMLGVVSGVTGLVMGLFLGGWVGDVIPRRKEGTAEVDS